MASSTTDHVTTATALVDTALSSLGDTAGAVREAIADCENARTQIEAADITKAGVEAIVTEIGARATKLRTKMEKTKDALMRPLNDKRKILLDAFNGVDAALQAVIDAAGSKLKQWRRIEEERRLFEAQRDQDHELAFFMDRERTAAAEERERQHQLQLAAALEAKGQTTAAAAALDTAIAVPETRVFSAPASLLTPAAAAPVHGVKLESGGSGTLSDDYDFEVIDAWRVPQVLCKPPEVKRKETLAVIKSRILMKTDLGADGLPMIDGLRVTRKEVAKFAKR